MSKRIGKYEILEELGSGGMAVVYRARDTMLGRDVALKLINQRLRGGEAARKRFFNEGRIAAGLSHPNIVIIHDLDVCDDFPFIAMEYLPGCDLQELINQKVPLELEQTASIALQVARGLHHAHGRGVIHRDVKPANIRILADGVVKLLDFGIAKIAAQDLTQSGALVGSPPYMSPEQIKDKPLTPASDIFSFGIVLYELLTGCKPFDGPVTPAIIYKILSEEPPPLGEGIPPELKALVEGCLQKQLERRFQSFEAVLQQLLHIRRQLRRAAARRKAMPRRASAVPEPGAAAPSAERTPALAETGTGVEDELAKRLDADSTPPPAASLETSATPTAPAPSATVPGAESRGPAEATAEVEDETTKRLVGESSPPHAPVHLAPRSPTEPGLIARGWGAERTPPAEIPAGVEDELAKRLVADNRRRDAAQRGAARDTSPSRDAQAGDRRARRVPIAELALSAVLLLGAASGVALWLGRSDGTAPVSGTAGAARGPTARIRPPGELPAPEPPEIFVPPSVALSDSDLPLALAPALLPSAAPTATCTPTEEPTGTPAGIPTRSQSPSPPLAEMPSSTLTAAPSPSPADTRMPTRPPTATATRRPPTATPRPSATQEPALTPEPAATQPPAPVLVGGIRLGPAPPDTEICLDGRPSNARRRGNGWILDGVSVGPHTFRFVSRTRGSAEKSVEIREGAAAEPIVVEAGEWDPPMFVMTIKAPSSVEAFLTARRARTARGLSWVSEERRPPLKRKDAGLFELKGKVDEGYRIELDSGRVLIVDFRASSSDAGQGEVLLEGGGLVLTNQCSRVQESPPCGDLAPLVCGSLELK